MVSAEIFKPPLGRQNAAPLPSRKAPLGGRHRDCTTRKVTAPPNEGKKGQCASLPRRRPLAPTTEKKANTVSLQLVRPISALSPRLRRWRSSHSTKHRRPAFLLFASCLCLVSLALRISLYIHNVYSRHYTVIHPKSPGELEDAEHAERSQRRESPARAPSRFPRQDVRRRHDELDNAAKHNETVEEVEPILRVPLRTEGKQLTSTGVNRMVSVKRGLSEWMGLWMGASVDGWVG